PDDAAETSVDGRFGSVPAALGAPPAAQHLLAGPGVEDGLRLRRVGALDSQPVLVAHSSGSSSSRLSRTLIQSLTRPRPAAGPAIAGSSSSTGTPAMWARGVTPRIRRDGATSRTAPLGGSPRASPPKSPGGRAR